LLAEETAINKKFVLKVDGLFVRILLVSKPDALRPSEKNNYPMLFEIISTNERLFFLEGRYKELGKYFVVDASPFDPLAGHLDLLRIFLAEREHEK
jgi:hypothetical protein